MHARRENLDVIGMGDDGLDGLPIPKARLLFAADVIFTSRRLAALLPDNLAEKTRCWPSPFSLMEDEIARLREQGAKVAILTSGDPLWHGAGAALLKTFGRAALRFHPAPSSFSLAAAHLGWALRDVETLSLHGVPPARIEPFIQPGARILALTSNGQTPLEVARRLIARGFGPSRMHILAHLGGKAEQCFNFSAQEIVDKEETGFPDLHVLAIEAIAGGDARILPRAPGLPDDAFVHHGQITKQVVRAITVSALCPAPGALLWDVGAGCGSISAEWLRLAGPRAKALAIERDEARRAMIARNAENLGALNIEVVRGEAPEALKDLPPPDAVFIGGAVRDDTVFSACMAALEPGGVLIANAVTTQAAAALAQRHDNYGGELLHIAISRAAPLGPASALRPALPVTQLRLRKPLQSANMHPARKEAS